ncbi:MAG TPA: APC family permease, partial [Candidatus Stackebrandtia faecavium]|nr:APC family permease [Candidatus Stackebrandtia faecavium]
MSVNSSTGPSLVESALAKNRLGVDAVMCFIATAATPLTVVGGVVTTGFAQTGLTGIPVAFLAVGAILLLFSVGYVAMSRQVTNAGAFYAYIAHIGRPLGVAGAWIALAAYNALQVGLYGLLGITTAGTLEAYTGITVPWWAVGLACWLLVAVLGLQAVDLNGRILAVLLVAEIAIIAVLSISNVFHPAGGTMDMGGLNPENLWGPGAGAILILAVLGFIGFEAATVYAEESRNPRRTVPIATYTSIIVLALLYTFASWAMTVAVGTEDIQARSADEQDQLIFNLANSQLGSTVMLITQILMITSIVAATVSFHNTVARYMFSLGREGVLPSALGRTSAKSSSPRAASMIQTIIGLAVIVIYAVLELDPLKHLFFYGGTSGGLGVLVLVTAASIAIVKFFFTNSHSEGIWKAHLAPILATLVLCVVLYTALSNFAILLDAPTGSILPWLIPTIYAAIAVAGILWGLYLSVARPQVYAKIGAGAKAVLD